VRAGRVVHPRAYRWSSYQAHADGAAAAPRSWRRAAAHAIA
jgi:hypothetical protein